LLDLHHATIINLFKNAEYWEQTKDEIYLLDTIVYRDILGELILESTGDIYHEIMNCFSLYDLEKLKRQIFSGKYLNKTE
jgi:hypothetical protein